MADYVTGTILAQIAEQDEASTSDVFDRLATASSRLFDRECEVPNDFFAAAISGDPGITAKTFHTNGGKYLQVWPYEAASITGVTVDGEIADTDSYIERDGYLIFDSAPDANIAVAVTARFGFPAIPIDIVQACIEQALFQWRRKDLAFTEMSGVATAALVAEFSPTFAAVTRRYRNIYSTHGAFA